MHEFGFALKHVPNTSFKYLVDWKMYRAVANSKVSKNNFHHKIISTITVNVANFVLVYT